jgi:hypothetical protein
MFSMNVVIFSYGYCCFFGSGRAGSGLYSQEVITIFCDVTPCSQVEVHWRLGGTHCTMLGVTRSVADWLTSQLSITVSNNHTLPVSVSYRDLTRRTAPYKLLS